MAFGNSKSDLERLAIAKFEDARTLFDCARWANAYYLSGYAVELGIKAVVARQIVAETLPDRSFAQSLYVHDYRKLVGLAGLSGELRAKQDADSLFAANWGIVGEWRPDSRYESTDKSSAHFMLNAVGDKAHGVLQWIRTYW